MERTLGGSDCDLFTVLCEIHGLRDAIARMNRDAAQTLVDRFDVHSDFAGAEMSNASGKLSLVRTSVSTIRELT
jgi:hypothetical protein